MIVLNAGVPRSGTVLVNAIIRNLLRAGGMRVAQTNPHGPDLPRLIRHVQENQQHDDRVVLVHTHSWDAETAGLLAESQRFVGFLNFRDPRDVCVSLMRLHDHDFDTALRMVQQAFSAFQATARQADVMIIPYELLVRDPQGHIFQIARRLGLWPGLDLVDQIAERTSARHHRAVMEKVQQGQIDGLTYRQNTHRVLAEDPRTLINDRHIQSGRAGRWRTELDDAQQSHANARLAEIIKRLGYTP